MSKITNLINKEEDIINRIRSLRKEFEDRVKNGNNDINITVIAIINVAIFKTPTDKSKLSPDIAFIITVLA